MTQPNGSEATENIIDKGLVTLQKAWRAYNVFVYKNNLDSDFAPPANVHEVRHRPHLHYKDLPEFIERLMDIQKLAPKVGGRTLIVSSSACSPVREACALGMLIGRTSTSKDEFG